MGLIDLHTHSNASDGILSPVELVIHALARGVTTLAISDHYTCAGITAAQKAGQELGVRVISAIELGDDDNIHLLGYNFDPQSELLNGQLQRSKNSYIEMIRNIVERLRTKHELAITFDEVVALAGSLNAVGKTHVRKWLLANDQADLLRSAFYKDPDLFDTKPIFRLDHGLNLLKQVGAKVVLAHPCTIKTNPITLGDTAMHLMRQEGMPLDEALSQPILKKPTHTEVEEIITSFVGKGLDGLEVYYPLHSRKDMDFLLGLAGKHNLIVTGGSDFHGGINHPGCEIGVGYGETSVPESVLGGILG